MKLLNICVLSCLFWLPLVAVSAVPADAGRTVLVGYYSAPGLMNGAADGVTKSGYAYDYIQEVANLAGWRYTYVYGSFGELYHKLQAGEIDMLPYVTKTAARMDEVLFTKLPMGDERLYIGSLKTERLSADLAEMKGRKVGIIKGAFSNVPFMDLLKQKNVDCELVPFSLAEERTAALVKGDVDYIVELSTAYQDIALHAVYEFGDKYPFYLAVSSKRDDLLTELNKVQETIDDANPGFLNALKMKYFKGIPLFKVLPEEGMAWLASHTSIRIGAYDHDDPYVIQHEDGTVSGIGPDYVSFMLKSLNLDIPVEWKVYDGREAALKALRANEVDLINPYYYSFGDAEREGVVISAPVFNSSFSILYQNNYSHETMAVVATPSTRLGGMYVRDNYPKAKIISCLNGYDCIDKLLAGEANCVVMHTSALNEIAASYNKNFHIKPLNASCPVCFAALPDNVTLLSAIDKAIPFLTDVELNAILDRYNVEEHAGITAKQFFRLHPEYVLAVLALLLLGAIVIIILKVRANRRQRESLIFANYFLGTFVSTYYVDLKSLAFKVYRRPQKLDREYPVMPSYIESIRDYIEKEVVPEDREVIRDFIQPENLRKRLREKAMDSIIYRQRVPDGEIVVRMLAVRGENENSVAFGFADVTDDVKAEEQRRNEEAEFAKVKEEQRKIDTIHDIIHSGKWSFLVNAQDEIVDAKYSNNVEMIIDNELHDGEAYAWTKIVHPDDLENAVAAFKATIADHSGNTPYDVIYRMRDRHGEYHWFHSAGRIIRQEDGSGEFFGIHINITHTIEKEREQQRQLETALERAESANCAKTSFLFNMSHDIRTPMNAILGFTGMAQKHLEDREKVNDCLIKSQQAGNLLLALINSVLDMSRIESGKAEQQENPGDVYYSFSNIESALQEIAATRDVKLSFEFGEITDRFVYADFQRCVRIFTNLIANAIKYSHEGGYVKVTCTQTGAKQDGYAVYRYTIEDNGIGMSEEFQRHMFEPFAREQNTTHSGVQGTGLGLAVCKTFVEYLKGTIECVSKLGEGTTFIITLPFRVQEGRQYTDPVTGEVVSGESQEENARGIDFSGKKVLLVEDNELNREIAIEILEEAGMVVEEAEDGSVAVDILKSKGPDYYDFILMDIQMPVMNGYEATQAIRDMYPNARIPIIAVSANAFDEDRKASRKAGMDDHVAKPIKPKELFAALNKFM